MGLVIWDLIFVNVRQESRSEYLKSFHYFSSTGVTQDLEFHIKQRGYEI